MHEHYIQLIKSAGYRVFVRPGRSPVTYCFYTDGKRIGYAQWGNREHVSTVHKPCRECGTGFHYADQINPETIKGALFAYAPDWAYSRERNAVRKYRDWDEYVNASKFNGELTEV